jgi:hypothetical protein
MWKPNARKIGGEGGIRACSRWTHVHRGLPEHTRDDNRLSRRRGRLAERVGFEPTCRLPDKTLSRRPRYDHFGTSPQRLDASGAGAGTINYTWPL